jgi:hypothetical protein
MRQEAVAFRRAVFHGPKMHESLPDPEVITGQIKRYNQQPAAAHKLCVPS